MAKTSQGIYVSSSTNAVLSGNRAHNNSDAGIVLPTSGATGIQVIGNLTYQNARGYTRAAPGIDVRSSGNIIKNNISHDEDSGIQFYNGANNNLVANTFATITATTASTISALQGHGSSPIASIIT